MKTCKVPDDVLTSIREAAEELWGQDEDLVSDTVESESEAYLELQSLDFGEASDVAAVILAHAAEVTDSWEERFSIVGAAIEAIAELKGLQPADVPAETLRQLRAEAAREHETDHASQRDYVVGGIAHYRYVTDLTAKVGPARDLLIEMERIIGSECYNANIQNYGSWGVWEGEGRSFRYPLTFIRGDRDEKRWSVPADLNAEILMTGRYKFGANEMSIFRALLKIVDLLEQDYGLNLKRSRS